MKKSKWLIFLLVILLLVAGVAYAVMKGKTSADALFSKSNDLTCTSKEVTGKVLFNLGTTDNLYLGTKSVRLNTSEKAHPEGIFLRKGNAIYFTNGLRYSSLPEIMSSDKITFKIGDIYYIADLNTATDISNIKLTPSQILVAYKEYAYIVDLSTISVVSPGYLYQKNGLTRICASANSYEIDVARKAYSVLTDSSTEDWKTAATVVTEKFIDNTYASFPPTSDEARAKVAIEALTESAKKLVFSYVNSSIPYSTALARYLDIDKNTLNQDLQITGSSRGGDGTVTIHTILGYNSNQKAVLRSFVLIQEGNTWKVDKIIAAVSQ